MITEFQLYKRRDFSDLITDTFSFFKLNGKHFFKHYLVLCGGFILIIAVISYFFFQAYTGMLMAPKASMSTEYLHLFESNPILGIALVLVAFILFFIFMLVTYLYPIGYLKLYSEDPTKSFGSSEILNYIKSHSVRLVKYSLMMMLITMTVGILVIIGLILICVTIIGIPVAILGFLGLMAGSMISLFIYMNDKEYSTWGSLSSAYAYVRKQFWPIVGSFFVILLIIQTITGILTFIPMMATIFQTITTINENSALEAEASSSMTAGMTIIMVLSYILGLILNNVLFVNSGLAYYSMKDEQGGPRITSEIDKIGTDIE